MSALDASIPAFVPLTVDIPVYYIVPGSRNLITKIKRKRADSLSESKDEIIGLAKEQISTLVGVTTDSLNVPNFRLLREQNRSTVFCKVLRSSTEKLVV